MSDFSALVAEFIGITACDASSAAACLRAHGNSLERAVSAYFDGWREDSTATATATAPDGGENDDEMRAPIAPRSEQLLTEHDLRFGPVGTARRTLALSGRAHGSPQRCVFDAFRNFRQEGASSRNDDEGGQNNDGSTAAAPSDSDDNSADDDESGETAARTAKVSKLAQQFRRPTDLAVDADFDGACACAAAAGLLLVANVQDVAEFASHVLNRDVWADAGVRAALRGRFVLWQCGSDCADAQRFVRLYRVPRLPHVCVLDPLTGEVLRTVDVPMAACVADAAAVARQLEEVAREHRGHPAASHPAGTQGPVRAPSAESLEDEFEFSSDDGSESSNNSSSDDDGDDDERAVPTPAKRARSETAHEPDPVPAEESPQEGSALTVQVRVVGQRPVVVQCTDTERVGALAARLQQQLGTPAPAATLCTAYPRRALDPARTLRECGVRDRSVLVLEPK